VKNKMVKKVWVNFVEKFHGKTYNIWKNTTLTKAENEVKSWNRFGNPQEKLKIKYVDFLGKPKGLKATKVKGVYVLNKKDFV
jgi:hypothetical protein